MLISKEVMGFYLLNISGHIQIILIIEAPYILAEISKRPDCSLVASEKTQVHTVESYKVHIYD